MDREARRDVGATIAAVRSARGLNQRQLAAEAKVSLSLLCKIEQGARPATPPVLNAIAGALGVDPSVLSGEGQVSASPVHAAIPVIRRALDSFEYPEDGAVRPLAQLGRAVAEAQRWRLSSMYAQAAVAVPPLVVELCRAFHGSSGVVRAQAAGLLTEALRSLDGVTYKFGYHDLSARIIDVMRRTAVEADDPLLTAMVAYVHIETFFATGNLGPALRSLDAAATRVEPGTLLGAASVGALHTRAAVVAGRLGDRAAARSHLVEARDAARRVPDGTYYGTAFGPASVRVHEVAVAVELGDERAALRAGAGWAPPVELPAERRSHFYVDLARAQLWAGRREAAFASLVTARSIAPQHVREHPYVRDTTATLLRLQRAPGVPLRGFARWLRIA